MTTHLHIPWPDGSTTRIETSTAQALDLNAGTRNHLALVGDEQISVDDDGTITTHDSALPLDNAA